MSASTLTSSTTDWTLRWAFGLVTVQSLGAMVGPISLRLQDGSTLEPMYRAPWHGENEAGLAQNALLRHLNGEWLCLPYGPAGQVDNLPQGWKNRTEPGVDAEFDHGWCANQNWQLERQDEHSLVVGLLAPEGHPIERFERRIEVEPNEAKVSVTTTVFPRVDVELPIALHPTFSIPAGGVELHPKRYVAAHAYPKSPVPGTSRLMPGGQALDMDGLPTTNGEPLTLSRLPLVHDSEELLQLQECTPPMELHLSSASESGKRQLLRLDWDQEHLPDVLIWISQRGRTHAPWNARNVALGIEPCASCFDLTRVAEPPATHPLSHRRGIQLKAGQPLALRWSLAADTLS